MQVQNSTTGKAKGFNRNHRKENHFQHEFSVMAIDVKTGEIAKKISCRIYGTQSTNYCCIWVSSTGEMRSGSGSAGGYGYHRVSGAVNEAIEAAGYTLIGEDGKRMSIAGVGDSAIKEALMGIAILEGYNKPQIFEAHP